MTNCSAITFIACLSATRTTGSPARATIRSYHAFGSRAWSLSIRVRRPVSIKPHVDALTSNESDAPRCFSQSPRDSLSRISRSAVSASGMRSSASAMHMRSTPSCVDRSYCCRKDSTPGLPCCRLRTPSTQVRARCAIAAAASPATAASSARRATVRRSSARNAARTAALSGWAGRKSRRAFGMNGIFSGIDRDRSIDRINADDSGSRWTSGADAGSRR